jgi:hypothetical protein
MRREANVIKTSTTEIWLEGEHILWAKILPDTELNEEEFESCFNVYKQLCAEKKRVQIIDARALFRLTEKAKNTALFTAPLILSPQL